MYQKAYGIIETQAPLYVGAASGEETGNVNLIFRDQFTQTGIIPGSSIRGRLRADMYEKKYNDHCEQFYKEAEEEVKQENAQGVNKDSKKTDEERIEEKVNDKVKEKVDRWYGKGAQSDRSKNYEAESVIKFEHASIVWIPVFCPGQPIVWVSCPRLLKRYLRITNQKINPDFLKPNTYIGSIELEAKEISDKSNPNQKKQSSCGNS